MSEMDTSGQPNDSMEDTSLPAVERMAIPARTRQSNAGSACGITNQRIATPHITFAVDV
jgi:hypothetical protein